MEQCALFEWVDWHVGQYPDLALLYAVPNGGLRNKVIAAQLKRSGTRAGVPDVCLCVARKGWHGLFIELKYGRNPATPEQLEWLARLTEQGYLAVCVVGWQAAMKVIEDYLGIEGE